MALNPAVGLDVNRVRPLVPKFKLLDVPTDMKAALDELLATLQTICLGSAVASRVISHWEGVMASRRSLRSGYGSDHELALKDTESQGEAATSNTRTPGNGEASLSNSPADSDPITNGQGDALSPDKPTSSSDVTLSS